MSARNESARHVVVLLVSPITRRTRMSMTCAANSIREEATSEEEVPLSFLSDLSKTSFSIVLSAGAPVTPDIFPLSSLLKRPN